MSATTHGHEYIVAPREIDGVDDVAVVHALHDQRGPLVDQPVPDPPRVIVRLVLWPDQAAMQIFLESLDRFLVHDSCICVADLWRPTALTRELSQADMLVSIRFSPLTIQQLINPRHSNQWNTGRSNCRKVLLVLCQVCPFSRLLGGNTLLL